ncbi:MAG: hypothetical protein ACK57V_13675 [Pirellula sp.]
MKSRKPIPRRKSPSTCSKRGRRNATRLWLLALLAPFFSVGCRRAAFNELYVENMASEVRMLEDRVYEYDAAYQALEQELADSQRAYLDIQSKLKSLKEQNPSASPERPFRLDSSPKEVVEPAPPIESRFEKPPKKEGDVELGPVVPRVPAKPPAKDVLDFDASDFKMPSPQPLPEKPKLSPEPVPAQPSDSLLPPPKDFPSSSPSSILPPSNLPGVSADRLPSRDKTTLKRKRDYDPTEEVVMPPTMIRSAQAAPAQPAVNSSPLPAVTKPPFNPGQPSSSQPNWNGSQPSLMTPPSLPKLDQGTILQGKIKLPVDHEVVLASAAKPIPAATDHRIVEIAFHPTMCRGHNFDESPGDDGLYLVVIPRNKQGEPINQSGDLTIVVEETIEGKATRIAAWEIGSKELSEYLEPIGTSQGYHLSLPWQKSGPVSTAVQVFVKFEAEDGRTMVNRREVSLRRPGARQSAWTPR